MARTKREKMEAKARKRTIRGLYDGIDLPELAPSRKRGKDKCFVERTRQQGDIEPDPRRTVLSARCRHLGKEVTEDNRLSVAAGILGDPAGRAIAIGAANDRDKDRMWKTFMRLDAAVAGYHHRILQQNRFAKCGKVEYLPERFATAPEDAPSDPRDDATKDRDAINAWSRWRGFVGSLGSHEQTAIWNAVWLRVELSRGGNLTTAGEAFVRAMRLLAEVAKIG